MKLEEVKEAKKPEKKLRMPSFKFEKYWLGYFVIGCAIALSVLILVGNIVVAVGSSSPKKLSAEAEEVKEEPQSVFAAANEEIGDNPITISTDAPIITSGPPEEGEEVEVTDDWHYYNRDLQDDGFEKNDYNFGPNPVLGTPEALESLAKILERKGIKDTVTMEEVAGEVDPMEIDKDFRERMRKDPALGAADMAWADSILGTRYLGVFYSEAKEQWDAAMNKAKEHFIADKDDYYDTLDAFEKYLDSATKVEIKKQTSGLTDQMYMNPYTKDEIPDIIVMESADHAGWFLVYTFTIKETAKKEIRFRLDCGYQPTNVAKVMKVTAKKNPNKPKPKVTNKTTTPTPPIITVPQVVNIPTVTNTPVVPSVPSVPSTPNKPSTPDKPIKPDPIPTPVPVSPDPTPPDPNPIPTPPDPIPTPAKDPTNGTPVLSNDGTGPGEDTNNPSNPDFSTADQETNSNHQTSGQYDQAMEDNHWANEVGREGGDSNEPSTPPPSEDTNQDNNGDKIDGSTEKSESSVDHDSSGDHWDGPPE